MAFESYFDGSNVGGWDTGRTVTLAGFAAEDSIWLEVDKEWRRILSDTSKRPPAEYLHMREATHLEKEFSFAKGWTIPKVNSLVMDLLMYLQHVDKERFRMFWCTVDLDAHRKLKDEGLGIAEPIEICIDCPTVALDWFFIKWPGIISSAHYFFDIGEPFKAPFEDRWRSKKAFSLDGSDHFWSLLKTVATVQMRDKPGLQAADLIAWAVNRKFSAQKDAAFSGVESIMQNVIPSSSILWDEQKLRERRGRIHDKIQP
ncbi:MAG TPA: DUF3800 domain-containing protein [Candidatus Acidoferrales bacterium]|nr:DUF3800 domain-containing protein [Candidatus Acidoferrales bacterium]